MVNLGNDWDHLLAPEFQKEYFRELEEFLTREYRDQTVYPPMDDIFNALKQTPYRQVKAVILGQDPYHGPGQAHGLCFSVGKDVRVPPSLRNVFKELKSDLSIDPPPHGCLIDWAREGVLLLNTVLTVRRGEAHSHKGKGWETLTDQVIWLLGQREEPMTFLLWGAHAKAKIPLVEGRQHQVLTAAHPSPLSAHNGFFGCRHFSQASRFLKTVGRPIDWTITH